MPGMFDTMLAKYFVGQEAVILSFSSNFFKFHRAQESIIVDVNRMN